MKYFSHLMIATAAFFLACNVYAAKLQSVEDCPSIATVMENSHFTKAIYADSVDFWGMVGNRFEDKSAYWNILFAVKLPNVKTSAEALEQGQAYFNEKVTLTNPTIEKESGYLVCTYSGGKDYLVAAVNPPLAIPDFASFARKMR